jgi:glycosyltransferase involved in cell wall biosynthesis
MILEKPVVATDVGGVSEVVKNEKTGILVKKRDPEGLAFGISRLLKTPELRKTLVHNALAFSRENFSVDKMVNAYMKIYGEVLESGSSLGKEPE